MTKVMRELVEYDGITMCPYEKIPYFTQLNVDNIFCIQPEKPDIDRIVSVYAQASITDSKLISTVKGTSLEGQGLTGYDVMICGEISLKIEYIECDSCNSCECNVPINTTESTFSFYGSVVLPQNININATITPSVAIEDILSEKMDLRCIYNNITIMLIADVSSSSNDLNVKIDNCSQNLFPIMPTYFKQQMVCENINLDPKRLDIERVIDVSVWPEISNIKLIDTAIGVSNEGQRLSGFALVVEVNLKEKITYIACEPTQMTQVNYYQNSSIINVVVPDEVNIKDINSLMSVGSISVTPYVEGIKFKKLDNKTINLCVMLLVDVKVC